MLLAYQSLHSKMHPIPYDEVDAPSSTSEPSSKDDAKEGKATKQADASTLTRGDNHERSFARTFTDSQISYLQSCPVILSIPLPPTLHSSTGSGSYLVSHAGLVPGVPAERQDPFQAMNMRTIDLITRVPSELRIFEPWEKVWGHAMGHVHPLEQRQVVVYGHDSKRGLNVKKYSKGLDSGCVRGGKLTALVLDGWGRERVVAARCKMYRKEKDKEPMERDGAGGYHMR